MQEAPCPGHPNQNATEPPVHDTILMQWLADGHVAVIGHGSEDNHLCSSKDVFGKELGHATFKGDGLPLIKRVYNHLRGDDGGEAGIQEGQQGQEEVHGGAQECWAAADGHHN